MKVLDIPSEAWVDRLRPGHFVWLVKEQQLAQVEFAWEPPEPGCCIGRMAIQIFRGQEIIGRDFVGIQTWYIGVRGEGLDGLQLIAPIKDNLPDNPPILPEPEIRKIHRVLASLSRRIDNIEVHLTMSGLL